ncbi:hypothetical protein [Rhodoferax sp.]|uniref:hypothetical protein n=1 Tax=Rhodoferax sp. TaxID=50421 RepID=UPI002615A65E|nr:hypothetical protein [Rhodoferax sp.]MDD5480215.1 hypothetical protein [Rhodoferax sp.]
MSNLTISVGNELIRQARIRATEQRKTVSAQVRDFLTQYVFGTTTTVAMTRPLSIMILFTFYPLAV